MSKKNPTVSYPKVSFNTVTDPLVKFAGKYQNTLILLRFHFSLFLLPVTLFSFYYAHAFPGIESLLMLIIWHVLIFPSSNGYNSWHDRDTGPIGGLAAPPLPDRSLLNACNLMDALALILSLLISLPFCIMAACYILASRLYSNRKTRLKKFPISGFLIVFIFQGFWVFMANITALNSDPFITSALLAALASSFFVGALYPVTQVYQHESDAADGVVSFSMMLGKKTTFLFTAFMFTCAAVCLYLLFTAENQLYNFMLFNWMMLPAMIFFLVWSIRSFRNPSLINFINTMILIMCSSLMLNLYFIILLLR